jgi:hypothetical protein
MNKSESSDDQQGERATPSPPVTDVQTRFVWLRTRMARQVQNEPSHQTTRHLKKHP